MNREIFDRLEQGSAARAANLMNAREVYRSRAMTAEPISLNAKSRRGFNPLTRLALLLTALAAPAVALLHDGRPVSADELTKPSIYKGADGNEFTVATFRKPGRAYIFTSETGLRVADGSDASGGVVYGGKEAKVVIVANAADMNARVTALNCGGLYIDVIDDVGGNGYMERAPNAMAVLEQEMDRVPVQDRAESSKVGIIIGKNDDLNQYFDEIGGSEKSNIGLESQGCSVPTEVPVLPAPVSQPEQPAPIENCSVGDLQIADLKGKGIASVSGVPARLNSGAGLDLADHGIFRPVSGLEALRNVLGEPGAFLADPNNIPAADKGSWDAKVNAGLAEYIRTSGPNINFYDLQTNSDRGVSWNAEKGVYEFRLGLPKHVIVRIDGEEMKMSLSSASGDRNIRFNLCQSGANRGVDFGHQTLFIRTPYEQESVLILESPTIPGTQVQILGMQVQSPTAFASAEAFMQGVGVRQVRADYPRYLAYTVNANDLTVGAVESPAPGAAFQKIGSNYQ